MKRNIILLICIILIMNCFCGSDNNKPKIQQDARSLSSNNKSKESLNTKSIKKIITPKDYKFTVIKTYPHPKKGFTQGFVWHNGYLYEGTGIVGQSYIRKIDLESNRILQERKLEGNLFGEGIAILKNKIYELTWTSNTCLVWDLESFNLITSFTYSGEGWGITTDGENLIVSDGTDIIRYFSPDDFNLIRTIKVTEEGNSIDKINELEYIDSKIWANIWMEDKIIIIDPASGLVTGRIDIHSLRKYLKPSDEADVLNGIAWDSISHKLYITGKEWPFIFEVKVNL